MLYKIEKLRAIWVKAVIRRNLVCRVICSCPAPISIFSSQYKIHTHNNLYIYRKERHDVFRI